MNKSLKIQVPVLLLILLALPLKAAFQLNTITVSPSVVPAGSNITVDFTAQSDQADRQFGYMVAFSTQCLWDNNWTGQPWQDLMVYSAGINVFCDGCGPYEGRTVASTGVGGGTPFNISSREGGPLVLTVPPAYANGTYYVVVRIRDWGIQQNSQDDEICMVFNVGPAGTATNTPTYTNTLTNTPTQTPVPGMIVNWASISYGDADDAVVFVVTQTPSNTGTNTPDVTVTHTYTVTSTFTATGTATETASNTTVFTATRTHSPTATATPTSTSTSTNTPTATSSDTPQNTETHTYTATETFTPTKTPTLTSTDTPAATLTDTSTATPSDTETSTMTHTATGSATFTSTATMTFTPTDTDTGTATSTPTNTQTFAFTVTHTFTDSGTSTPTATNTDTSTATHTFTPTSTSTPVATQTGTSTATAIPTGTATSTRTSTVTHSVTWTYTDTATSSETATFTRTHTPVFTDTPAVTHTQTPVPATPTPTDAGVFDITKDPPVIVFPNPGKAGEDMYVRFSLTQKAASCSLKIYTAAFRLVKEVRAVQELPAGPNTMKVPAGQTRALSPGTYYYVMAAENYGGEKARSAAGVFILLK